MHKNKIPSWKNLNVPYIPTVVSAAAASMLFLALIGSGIAPTLFFERPDPLRSSANGELLSASPNPITVCGSSRYGTTLLSWNTNNIYNVRIRKGGPGGQIVANGSGSGAQQLTTEPDDVYILYEIGSRWKSANGKWRRVKAEIPLSQVTITHTQKGCSSQLPAPSGLNGAFMYAPTLPTAKMPAYFDELKSLAMDTVIIAHVRTKTGNCSTNTFSWGPEMPDKLGTILTEAQSRNMQVYAGLTFSMDACQAYYSGDNATQVINDTSATIAALTQRYGQHAALAGWYIPDEPDFVYMNMDNGTEYYRGIVNKIREKSEKPILIAPFFAGHSGATPAQLAEKALDFKNRTGVTVQVWQDSIGADQSRILFGNNNTKDYYAALAAKLGQAAVWSDIELFNCCTGMGFSGGAYRPASISRIAKQIDSASGTAKRVFWLPQYHMGTVDANRYPGSGRLLSAYKAWYGLDKNYEYIRPQSYAWTTTPSSNYPDAQNELTNGITAPVKDFTNPEWVGILGAAEMIVDLGSSKEIDWVAVHTMHDTAPAIFIPSELGISCSTDGIAWSSQARTARPVTAANSEYVFSNSSPLNLTCRYIKARLQNTGWTFVSEIEIVNGD